VINYHLYFLKIKIIFQEYQFENKHFEKISKKKQKNIWINKILSLIFAPLYKKANVI
jgi:hypothetical protein